MVDTTFRRSVFLRDFAAAVIVIASFIVLLPLPVVQMPGYLLILGHDTLERSILGGGSLYGLTFLAYVLVLAVGAAILAGPLRERTPAPEWYRPPIAAGLTVTGLVVLAVGVGVLLPGAAAVPLVLSLVTAAALFGGAAFALWAGSKTERRVEEKQSDE